MDASGSLRESISKSSDELDDVFESSDEYHVFPCSTCLKEGKSVNAEMYCVECDHFLCQICLKQHNKFDSMKNHQVVKDSSSSRKDDKQRSWLDLPSQRCETHHGKLIDMFCRNHNEVCCGACASLKHSSCLGMVYLPQIANMTDVTQKAKDMLKKMETIQSRAKDLTDTKQLHVKKLMVEKEKLSDQIKESCSKIVNHFKKLETELLYKLDDKVHVVEDDLHVEISKTADVTKALKSEHLLLTKFLTAENVSSLFVQLKLADKCHLQCTDTLNHLKTSSETNIEFTANYKAADVIDEIKSLGDINENEIIKSFSLFGDFEVKAPSEKSTCDITDVIMHNDGSVLITDFENRSLKRLDSQFVVQECLSLPGQPNALCFAGDSSAVVALTDKKVVQFVSLRRKMALTTSFSVRASCRGVAHKDGLIYVTCGGNRKYGEGKGLLCVYSYSGDMLKFFDTDVLLPKHIHIFKHKDGQRMYIADTHKCLLIMTTGGRLLERRIFKDIDNIKGICSGPGYQHFLSGYNSNTIILVSGNAHQLCTLNLDGLRKPQALCFDQNKLQLIIAMDKTNALKVLDLTFE